VPPVVDTLLVSDSEPRSAYMWPEVRPGQDTRKTRSEAFVFQYWPESLTDSESPRYVAKDVPGASHSLYQWIGGGERTITFSAVFTAEVDDDDVASFAGNPAGAAVLPSARYTVDVKAALAKLKTYQRGDYPNDSLNQATKPPKRLWLVLENSGLGGNTDSVLTILKSAPVTYEAWFPNGKPRIATVQLTFAEVVQKSGGDGEASQIAYLGQSSFAQAGAKYRYRGAVDRTNG